MEQSVVVDKAPLPGAFPVNSRAHVALSRCPGIEPDEQKWMGGVRMKKIGMEGMKGGAKSGWRRVVAA